MRGVGFEPAIRWRCRHLFPQFPLFSVFNSHFGLAYQNFLSKEQEIRASFLQVIDCMRRTNKKILFGLLLSMLFLVASSSVWASNGFAEIEIPPRGTYLHADPGGEGRLPVDPPAVVDLQSNGFSTGDTLLITFEGSMRGSEDAVDTPVTALIGVFSSTNQILPISDADRVPGAVDAGSDFSSAQTFFTHEDTDIPEDFLITPSTGFSIEVPQSAKYLYISIHDSFYPDNSSPNPIGVTIEKQASETSTGGFPLEYILVALGVVALLAVLFAFAVIKRRKSKTQSAHGGGVPTAPESAHGGGGDPT